MTSSEFCDYVVYDLLAHMSGVTFKRMFGGFGLYLDGVVFGIIADGELYFKVDETNRAKYELAGSHPFVYFNGKKDITLSYWQVPAEILEQPRELEEWVLDSVQINLLKTKKEKKK